MSNPKSIGILDVNPLEHLSADIAISQKNYESILNGLVRWDSSKEDTITIRLSTRTEPYIVDYPIHTKYYYDKTYGGATSLPFIASSSLAYDAKTVVAAAIDDNLTIRVNVVDVGDTVWSLFGLATVFDEFDETPTGEWNTYNIVKRTTSKYEYSGAGFILRMYDDVTHKFVLYRTKRAIQEGATFTTGVEGNIEEYVGVCSSAVPVPPPMLCLATSRNKVYCKKVSGTQISGVPISAANSGYFEYCNVFEPNERNYVKGQLVYCSGDFFIANADNPANPPVVITTGDKCTYYNEQWTRVLPLPLLDRVLSGSGVIRVMKLKNDIEGLVLRNTGKTESSEKTSLSIIANVTTQACPTSQPTGLNIFPTSNYVNWPQSSSAKWAPGKGYATIPTKSAYELQSYSSVMVFNHYDTENFKYKNIVNYDGPDLDQGLCIMLPVTVRDGAVDHEPADGTMIEFLFNIWPNHDYDSRATNDLIINKSQIYVYSIPNYDDYLSTSKPVKPIVPLAKFSMARVTNFYVFSENVGVPDRPVCYKARFIYSALERTWKTYDYYQLPDHVFFSPRGYVDPSDEAAYGVETAGFPLYQNPFSDYDLSAIHVDENYRNQIQSQEDD